MINSKIDWTDHSLNFWTGCKKIREGCQNCYMFREQKRYGNDPILIKRTTKNTWNQVKKFKPGEKVFVCSWSDFFIEEADFWREEAWAVIRSRPDLIWMLLTKRIKNVESRLPEDWGDGWPNVIGMVTAENQKWVDHDIPILLKLPFAIKGISVEPMLDPINIRKYLPEPPEEIPFRLDYLNWVVAGCESGPKRRDMKLDWVKDLKNQCVNANVPFFLKQRIVNNKIVKMPVLDGQIWNQFPDLDNENNSQI
jgi:protein gp37